MVALFMVYLCYYGGGYLLFYLIFKYLPISTAVFIFISLSIAYIVLLSILGVPRYWYGGSLGISIGIMWRRYEDVIKHIMSSNIISMILFVSAFTLWIVFSKYIQFKEFHPLFTSIILMVVIHHVRFPKIGACVHFLSDISFELYLFQALAMRIVFDYISINLSWVAMILLLFVNIFISTIFHFGLIKPLIFKLSK